MSPQFASLFHLTFFVITKGFRYPHAYHSYTKHLYMYNLLFLCLLINLPTIQQIIFLRQRRSCQKSTEKASSSVVFWQCHKDNMRLKDLLRNSNKKFDTIIKKGHNIPHLLHLDNCPR